MCGEGNSEHVRNLTKMRKSGENEEWVFLDYKDNHHSLGAKIQLLIFK